MHPRTEMLDLVVIDGTARGIVTRNLQTGAIQSHVGDVVVLATGGSRIDPGSPRAVV